MNAAPKNERQCASEIHVFPLQKDIEFKNVVFAPRMIIISAEPEDVAFQKGNGKLRLRKATLLRDAAEADKGKRDDTWEAAHGDLKIGLLHDEYFKQKPTVSAMIVE